MKKGQIKVVKMLVRLNWVFKNIWHIVCKVLDYTSKHFLIIVNVLANIGTAVAACVAIFALKEAVFQRESMYKPELFIGTVDFVVDISNKKDLKFYAIVGDSICRQPQSRPWYWLQNVGVGSGLSVYGCMKFNEELVVKYLNENGLKNVKKVKGKNLANMLVYNNDTMNVLCSDRIADWKVDYVLPINQAKKESIQYFPPIVINNIIKAYLWIINEKNNGTTADFFIPIELDYKDINEKWYRKKFELIINCSQEKDNKDVLEILIRSDLPFDKYVEEMGVSML